jgi:VIT1/CCC1 family predicted Fe2+/Mn2+ transporter
MRHIAPLPPAYIALSAVKDESDFLFGIACGLTAIALFALGAIKSKFSTQKWYTSGLWVLLNGGLAAAAAFLVGFLYVARVSHLLKPQGRDVLLAES